MSRKSIVKTISLALSLLILLTVLPLGVSAADTVAVTPDVTVGDVNLLDIVNVDDENISITDLYKAEYITAYKTLYEYKDKNDIALNISLETFVAEYENGTYSSLDNYLEKYYSLLQSSSENNSVNSSSSSGANWYYNTGVNPMYSPLYTTKNILWVAQPGDILYEDAGGFGLTGHTAIVEGTYYSARFGQFYIRVVEAIGYLSGSAGDGDGVCRGVLDGVRYSDREGTLLRVANATEAQKTAAVNFCVNQIGKGYNLDLGHDTSSAQSDWYCSELIWAAYYSQGIDLETDSTMSGITPHELRDSSRTYTPLVSTIGTPKITSITVPSSTSAKVSWSSVSGATQYYIYRSTSANGTYSYVSSVSGNSYTDVGLTTGQLYFYRVSAFIQPNFGNMSQPKSVTVGFVGPTILSGYSQGASSVYIQWSPVYNATGYYVYRSTSSSGTYTKIATVSENYYVSTGLTEGTKYYYKIAAYNSSSTTSQGSYRLVTPYSIYPPTFYYNVANSQSSVTVKWTNVSESDTYYVYRSTSVTGTYTKIASTDKTSYTDTNLAPNTTYYYKIKSVNSSNSSQLSDSCFVKTLS